MTPLHRQQGRAYTLHCKVSRCPGEAMRESDKAKALADIVEIRSQIAAGTAFRGYGPVAIAITALLGLGMAAAQSLWPIAATPTAYVAEWMATAAVCAAVIRLEMQGRSRRLHSSLADTMINQAIEHFLPATAASFFLPALFLRFIPEATWMMPGLWQIFVSVGIFASVRTLPKWMVLTGAWYFVTGFGCLLLGSQSHTLSPWMMGLPFSIGQGMMAVILYYWSGDADGED